MAALERSTAVDLQDQASKDSMYQMIGKFGFDFLSKLKFKNRLGTAAGLDKNGDYIDALGEIGFGFLEVGTITPKAQKGNSKPRVFRNFKENSIINRLGFNNKGVDHLVKKLKSKKTKAIIEIGRAHV